MSKKFNWFWLTYFIIAAGSTSRQIINFILPEHPPYFYFQFLNTYHFPLFHFDYILNLLQLYINLVACFAILLLGLKKKFGSKVFWLMIFVLKIYLDIIGHAYAMSTFVSLYYPDRVLFILYCVALAIVYSPFYVGLAKYAFWYPKN